MQETPIAIDRLNPPVTIADVKSEREPTAEVVLVVGFAYTKVRRLMDLDTGEVEAAYTILPMTAEMVREYKNQGGQFAWLWFPVSAGNRCWGRNGQSRSVGMPAEDPLMQETVWNKLSPNWTDTFNRESLREVYPEARFISYQECIAG